MTIFNTLPGFITNLTIIGVPVVVIVEILKKIPNKYWAFPDENGNYGTLAATVISIIGVLAFAYCENFLKVEFTKSIAVLIIGVIPFSLGLYNLIKRTYSFFKARISKKD